MDEFKKEDFAKLTDDNPGENTKKYPLGETGKEKSINFQIGPVPCVLSFGFNINLGVELGADYNVSLLSGDSLAGFSAGAKVAPYISAGGFLAVGLHPQDDLKTFLPVTQKLGDEVRRVLKIGGQHYGSIAGRLHQGVVRGAYMPEIARVYDYLHILVFNSDLF